MSLAATRPVSAEARLHALESGAVALGVTLTPSQGAQLLAFLDLLAKWNRTYNLTAIREPERMITHHVLDALAVLPHLPERAGLVVLDVGSGGGIPGIPLAIMRPDWQVTLVDASHKKATFLTQATIELGLANVVAHATRVEDFAPAGPYDIVISRAFSELADFANASARHLAPGGLLVAMKGLRPDVELAALPAGCMVLGTPSLTVPGLNAARHLVLMQCAKDPVA